MINEQISLCPRRFGAGAALDVQVDFLGGAPVGMARAGHFAHAAAQRSPPLARAGPAKVWRAWCRLILGSPGQGDQLGETMTDRAGMPGPTIGIGADQIVILVGVVTLLNMHRPSLPMRGKQGEAAPDSRGPAAGYGRILGLLDHAAPSRPGGIVLR